MSTRPPPEIFVSHASPEADILESSRKLSIYPVSVELPEYDASKPLSTQLRAHAMKQPKGYSKRYWPDAFQQALVTEEGAYRALIDMKIPVQLAKVFASQVCRDGQESCRRIFIILTLVGSTPAQVQHVLECNNGIRDDHLPLDLDDSNGQPRLLRRDGRSTSCCFADWSENIVESFEREQWGLKVPTFRLHGIDNTISHQDLDDHAILPWCEESQVKEVAAISGGFGTVTRVKIHPLCHEYHKVLESINVASGYFAIKKLKNSDKKTFETEVNALKRFNGKIHEHLVTLLGTFTQNNYYHLIFPWADYDLDNYWAQFPNPDLKDVNLIRWLSKQCLGIMEAAKVIHNPTHLAGNRFGRHGDIKAENILWYPSDKGGRGILVLSDLGLASLNTEKSRSMHPGAGLSTTPSYRPPECDIKGGTVSRAFDIWTLGCLYLELLCWLLQGHEGKLRFDRERLTPFIYGVSTDIFFDVEPLQRTSPSQEHQYAFIVKEAVTKKINELHANAFCTKWVHALLTMIEEDMLVVLSDSEKGRRKSSAELLEELRKLDIRCEKDKGYCLTPCPEKRPLKRPVGTLAALNEAAESKIKLTRNNLRTHQQDEWSLHKSWNPQQFRNLELRDLRQKKPAVS